VAASFRPAGWVAAALGLGLLVFGAILQNSGCLSCATGIPPVAVMLGGVGWILVALLSLARRPAAALTGAILLTSTHAGLIAFAGGRACAVCFAFIVVETASTLLLLADAKRSTGARWAALTLWALGTGLAAFAGSSVGLRVLYPVLPTRTLGPESRPLNDPKTTVIYVIVHRGCHACDVANDRMAEALQQGLPLRALIVDVRSDLGESFLRKHNLVKTPAFVAMRGQQVLGVQDGDTVDVFLRTLERQGFW
jgi:hypothetical protein